MAARNSLKNKALRREDREQNRKKQLKKRLAQKVNGQLFRSELIRAYGEQEPE